jgi:hypothetical protein
VSTIQKQVFGICIFALIGFSFGQSHWDLRNPIPASSNLYGVAFGDTSFVAVGQDSGTSGVIYTSTTGASTWTQTLKAATIFNGVSRDTNGFVAVGAGGVIYTSPDGATWHAQTSGTGENLSAVSYCNGRFVAVGGTDTSLCAILSSTDGATWTKKVLQSLAWLYGITYGDSLYVAVGNDVESGQGIIYTSPDDSVWTGQTIQVTNRLLVPAYGNDTFVVVGTGSTFTSPDGSTWTKLTSGTLTPLRGLTFGDSLFVAVGNFGTILTSPNGQSWTKRSTGTYTILRGVTFGDSMFVAVGDSGTVLTSKINATEIARKSQSRPDGGRLSLHVANNLVTIALPRSFDSEIARLDLFNSEGKCVRRVLAGPGGLARVSAATLPAGRYLVRISSRGKQVAAQFVLTK